LMNLQKLTTSTIFVDTPKRGVLKGAPFFISLLAFILFQA